MLYVIFVKEKSTIYLQTPEQEKYPSMVEEPISTNINLLAHKGKGVVGLCYAIFKRLILTLTVPN